MSTGQWWLDVILGVCLFGAHLYEVRREGRRQYSTALSHVEFEVIKGKDAREAIQMLRQETEQ